MNTEEAPNLWQYVWRKIKDAFCGQRVAKSEASPTLASYAGPDAPPPYAGTTWLDTTRMKIYVARHDGERPYWALLSKC